MNSKRKRFMEHTRIKAEKPWLLKLNKSRKRNPTQRKITQKPKSISRRKKRIGTFLKKKKKMIEAILLLIFHEVADYIINTWDTSISSSFSFFYTLSSKHRGEVGARAQAHQGQVVADGDQEDPPLEDHLTILTTPITTTVEEVMAIKVLVACSGCFRFWEALELLLISLTKMVWSKLNRDKD